MCSVQIFKFLAKIYIINLIFSQEYIFIAFSQESAFSFSQVSNMHLAKIYMTRIRVPWRGVSGGQLDPKTHLNNTYQLDYWSNFYISK